MSNNILLTASVFRLFVHINQTPTPLGRFSRLRSMKENLSKGPKGCSHLEGCVKWLENPVYGLAAGCPAVHSISTLTWD